MLNPPLSWIPDAGKTSADIKCSLEEGGHLTLAEEHGADWNLLEGKGCVPPESSVGGRDGRPGSI